MQQQNLPRGFISIEEAIKLIESDTRKDAKVDTSFLLRNLPYLRTDGNYTIKKLRHDKETGRVVSNGEVFVMITSDYEKEMLKHAIVEHYRNVTGRTIDPDNIGLRSLTTTVDEETNLGAAIIHNDKPTIKPGEDLGTGTRNIGA